MRSTSRLLITLALALYILPATSQTPTRIWDKRFGGSEIEALHAIVPASDGGYLLAGTSKSPISGDKTQDVHTSSSQAWNDFWIVKIDANGVKQWDARFGGDHIDNLWTAQPTSDGGYLLGGSTYSPVSGDMTQTPRGGSDYWIVKVNGNGVKQWDARYGGSGDDELKALQPTSDGGFILGGKSKSPISGEKSQDSRGGDDYWIVKIDGNGTKQWDARYGGNSLDDLVSIDVASDGGYILGGTSASGISSEKTQPHFGINDYWAVKVSSTGAKEWDVTFGGNDHEMFGSVIHTADGGFLLGGRSYSGISGNKTVNPYGSYDFWVIKISAGGVKEWEKEYGGSGADELTAMIQTTDAGYIFTGTSNTNVSGDKSQVSRGTLDYWAIKVNNSGTKEWDVTFGGADADEPFAILQTNDGFIIGGTSKSLISGEKSQDPRGYEDYWIVKASTVIMPLQFLSFTASVAEQNTKLNWQVSGDGRIASFDIERSTNGTTFIGIGKVTPVNGNVQQFSYTDAKAFANTGVLYYRIRMNNVSGAAVYSNILPVKLPASGHSITVYPNPVRSVLTISMRSVNSGQAMLHIINAAGKVVRQQSCTLANGVSAIQVNVSDLPAGFYTITIAGDTLLRQNFLKE